MNFPDGLLPAGLLWIAHGVWLLVLVQSLRHVPWRAMRVGRRQHLFLGAVVALLFLWSFEAGVTPGLGFHFLGLTVVTLMFGWALAVLAAGLALLGITLNGGGGIEAMSLNALVLGAVPVAVSWGVYSVVSRYLPHHVFIYIFLNAFLGAILAAAAAVFILVWVLTVTDTYTYARIAGEYLPFMPLYLFPEGLLNGMLITVFVGLRPEWLRTFDDESYLRGR